MANYPGRTDGDELWACCSCGMTVMSRGADVSGWKGAQLGDDPLVLSWFCDKQICQEAMHTAVVKRTKELRVRAGLSPLPPMKATKSKRRLRDILTGADTNVFGIPPGGFAAVDAREAEHVEEEPERDGGGKPGTPGVQGGGPGAS